MNNLDELYVKWTQATAALPWGVQRVFHDVFDLAQQGKTTLIYGSDYRDGKPCLVNTVGSMLKVGGGHGIPTQHFGEVVSLFDQINRVLQNVDVNTTPGYVSPLAADILLHHFAPLKEKPADTNTPKATSGAHERYIEPTDEEIARDLVNMFLTDAPCEIKFSEDLQYVDLYSPTTGESGDAKFSNDSR